MAEEGGRRGDSEGYPVGGRECIPFFLSRFIGVVVCRRHCAALSTVNIVCHWKKRKRIAIKEGKNNKKTPCFVQITSFPVTNGTEEEVK